jgi:putative thioredoxin
MRADKLAQTTGGAFEDVQAVRRIVALLEDESTDMPDDPARESYLMGVNALRSGDLDAALAGFVDSVRRNRRYHDDAARKTALALFNVLGDRHDLTRKHRRSLEMALF